VAYTATIDTANSLLGSSLDEINDWLGISGTGEANTVTNLVNETSWHLNRACNREFLQRSQTEYYDAIGQSVLWLKNPPVATLVLYEDSAYAFGTDTVVAATDYNLDTDSGRLVLVGGTFGYGAGIIKATYTGGYADGSIPMDLRVAAKIRVERFYRLWKSSAMGTVSRSDDVGGQTGYMHTEHPAVTAVIAKYRKVGLC
jgi:hypothetical protein